MNQHNRKQKHSPSHRNALLVLFLVPIFLSACVSSTPSKRWVNPSFASGQIPLANLELLPLRLALNIDGMSISDPLEVKKQQVHIATLVEKALRDRLSAQEYKVAFGRMSRQRLEHLIQEVSLTSTVASETKQRANIDPVLIAGGIPGTDAILLLSGAANVTTNGKKAAQVTTAVLLAALIVAVIVAMVVLTKKDKEKAHKSKRSKPKRASKSSRIRYRKYRSEKYRSYHRRRRSRIRSYRRGPRYYDGRYRSRHGHIVSYRVLRVRPVFPAPTFICYAPVERASVRSKEDLYNQSFFSNSYFDLSISVVEKGTGSLLWHDQRRWPINANKPELVYASIEKVFANFPKATPAPRQFEQEAPRQLEQKSPRQHELEAPKPFKQEERSQGSIQLRPTTLPLKPKDDPTTMPRKRLLLQPSKKPLSAEGTVPPPAYPAPSKKKPKGK